MRLAALGERHTLYSLRERIRSDEHTTIILRSLIAKRIQQMTDTAQTRLLLRWDMIAQAVQKGNR